MSDERYDPFGRPIEEGREGLWARSPKEGEQESGLPGGFLPPQAPGASPAPAPEAPERPAAPASWDDLAPPGRPTFQSTGQTGPALVDAPPVEMLASWGSRVGAYIIDAILMAVVIFVLAAIVGATGARGNTLGWVVIAAGSVVVALYQTAMLALTDGRTVGKRTVGIRVVRPGGEPMTWGRAALREIVMRWFVIGILGSITFGIAALLDVLWPLWDKQNQSLHDHAAETWVVRDRR